MMEARRKGCSKFQEIDIFVDVYVQPRDELTESFHATMVEKGQSVIQESASQLPPDMPIEYADPLEDAGFHILIEKLDQTFGRRPMTYCRGMGNARWRDSGAFSSSQSKGDVTALAQEVAGLRSELALYMTQMLLIVRVLSSFGIRLPDFSAPLPSKPLHPEHTQQSDPSTSNLIPNPTPF